MTLEGYTTSWPSSLTGPKILQSVPLGIPEFLEEQWTRNEVIFGSVHFHFSFGPFLDSKSPTDQSQRWGDAVRNSVAGMVYCLWGPTRVLEAMNGLDSLFCLLKPFLVQCAGVSDGRYVSPDDPTLELGSQTLWFQGSSGRGTFHQSLRTILVCQCQFPTTLLPSMRVVCRQWLVA